MVLTGFETDPVWPRKLRGLIHDVELLLCIFRLLGALISLWRRIKTYPRCRGHDRYALATGMLAIVFLMFQNVACYLFILALLAWIETTAILLHHRP